MRCNRILESECKFDPNEASPGRIIRGDGNLTIKSTQLGIDNRIPHNRCILPDTVEVVFESGDVRKFKLAGPAYRMLNMMSDDVAFKYWVYFHEGSCDINLHVLHTD